MKFIKKYWSEMLLAVFLMFMLLPQTRTPIQVFIQRIIAFSPNETPKEKQIALKDYHLEYEDAKNNIYNLEDHKGKVILINLWATWCPPCIAEMPSFFKVYSSYSDKVVFLFITNDEWNTIHKFEEKRKYQLPYYRMISANEELNSNQLPTTYLIDKEGNIVLTHVGVADWNSDSFREKLDQLIQE